MSIDRKRLDRLINIAGMLGSDFDGERANAARLATDELRRLGLTWRLLFEKALAGAPSASPRSFWETDLARAARAQGMNPFQHPFQGAFQHPFQGAPPPRPQQSKQRSARFVDARTGETVILWDVIARAAEIAREDLDREILTDWERAFISTFTGFGPRCMATPSQWAYVLRIRDKLRRFGVMAA